MKKEVMEKVVKQEANGKWKTKDRNTNKVENEEKKEEKE